MPFILDWDIATNELYYFLDPVLAFAIIYKFHMLHCPTVINIIKQKKKKKKKLTTRQSNRENIRDSEYHLKWT